MTCLSVWIVCESFTPLHHCPSFNTASLHHSMADMTLNHHHHQFQCWQRSFTHDMTRWIERVKGVIRTHLNSWWPVKGQLKWLAQDPKCLYPLWTTQVTLMLCSVSSSGWMDEDCASYCVLCHSLLLVVLVVIILMLSAYSENFRNETDSHHPLKDSRGNS